MLRVKRGLLSTISPRTFLEALELLEQTTENSEVTYFLSGVKDEIILLFEASEGGLLSGRLYDFL
jgi:hypothetical protein